jgi:hypothetical protein
MQELVRSALPFFAAVLVPALLLCLAPHLGARGRTVIGALFLAVSIGFAIDIAVDDHSGVHQLEVPNAFPRGPQAELHVWTVATVSAPAWHWHVFVIGLFAVPGLWLLLRRGRQPGPPPALLHGAMVFLFFLIARLGLELTAAPREIVWAIGATTSLFVVLPFFGYWCGRSGLGFGGWVARLVLLALLQRLPLIAFAYFATTRSLGTHLDTHVVTDINLAPFGERQLDTPLQAWIWPTLIPHLTVWVIMTLIAGLALGVLPRWLGRRQAED